MNKYILSLIMSLSVLSTTYTMNQNFLYDAIEYGNIEEVQRLINDGAQINIQNNYGNTPLHYAVRSRHIPIAQLLIIAGAQVDIKNNAGETPLHVAVFHRSIEIAELLIIAGTNIHLQDINGNTPLHAAAFYGNTEMVHLLIKHCQNTHCYDTINIKNNSELIPYQLAQLENHEQSAAFLRIFADILKKSSHLALLNSNIHQAIYLFINAGVQVNAQDDDGMTLLHYAAINGNADTVRLLISAGANVNIKNINDKTALHDAIHRGNTEVVKILLGAGADVHVTLRRLEKPWLLPNLAIART